MLVSQAAKNVASGVAAWIGRLPDRCGRHHLPGRDCQGRLIRVGQLGRYAARSSQYPGVGLYAYSRWFLVAGVYNAWAKVPEEGKLQILCLLLALETANESKKPHYMRGGVPGRIDSLPFDRAAGTSGLWAPKIKFWDPLNFTGALSAEQKARKRKAELKNGCATPPCAVRVRSQSCARCGWGSQPALASQPPLQRARSRLAMIGMVSFLIGHNLPGSVPALTSAF